MSLQSEADKVFSIFIRRRGSDPSGKTACFVCNRPMHWTEACCGHWQKRRNLGTRYHEINCQCICGKCNDESDLENDRKFEAKLLLKYGLRAVTEVIALAKSTVKMFDWEYQEIIDKYKGDH